MRFGVHLSISPRLRAAPERAAELGCDTFQIFCGNPRGWKKKAIDPEEAAEFREAVRREKLSPVVVHASYLINPACPKKRMHAKSVRAFAEELDRSTALGADYYIIHPGNHLGSGAAAGLQRLAAAVDAALGRAGDAAPMVLLENTAGGGSSVGGDIAELARVLDMVAAPDRVGLCFDTAHGYAAGYRIDTRPGLAETMRVIRGGFGLGKLRVIHCNDTRAGPGTHLDRHAHIGKGRLGRAGLRSFLSCKEVRYMPIILETPVDEAGDDERNLRAVKRLAPRARARRGGSR